MSPVIAAQLSCRLGTARCGGGSVRTPPPPDDPHIDVLVRRLRATSASFADLWDAKDVAPFVTTRRVFHHPTAGRLELDHHRLAVLDQPGMQLVVYIFAPSTEGGFFPTAEPPQSSRKDGGFDGLR
jgi:MmyB-like transcription regulator ligand binding domain